MNWVYNFYFREGPGIPKDAPKPVGMRLLAHVLGREWWELIKLNLLFIAFSLPLVTLPAAYMATVAICLAMIEDRNVYLLRDFWSAFRSRFLTATLLGLSFCGAGALVVLAVRTYAEAAKADLLFVAPFTVAVVVAILLPLGLAHLFVVLALGNHGSLRDMAKVAATGMLARPLPGLAALLFVALLWLAHVLFYPASVFLPVLVNFSLGALVTSFAVLKGVEFGFSHTGSAAGEGKAGRPATQSA
ncbi:YesL family protein [Allomesorhizobium camelthorni]|uniref:YesL family protein n=1 Tax=Allomesorhizobium camelthorni TaxID=475069 RepID=A0A6G4WF05_9HYPH|nr:YesL family protein [Mesorhizobium camelthorni]NGO52806.1 YesL family protein [Mesorhizobium camelthorni]